jgi:hypothetical protein
MAKCFGYVYIGTNGNKQSIQKHEQNLNIYVLDVVISIMITIMGKFMIPLFVKWEMALSRQLNGRIINFNSIVIYNLMEI